MYPIPIIVNTQSKNNIKIVFQCDDKYNARRMADEHPTQGWGEKVDW